MQSRTPQPKTQVEQRGSSGENGRLPCGIGGIGMTSGWLVFEGNQPLLIKVDVDIDF